MDEGWGTGGRAEAGKGGQVRVRVRMAAWQEEGRLSHCGSGMQREVTDALRKEQCKAAGCT